VGDGVSIFLVDVQEKKMIAIIAADLKAKILSLINPGMNLLKFDMKYLLSLVLFVFLFQGCFDTPFKKDEKELSKDSKISDTHFISDKIGWGIRLPGKDWEVIIPKETRGLNAKTRQDIEKALGVEIDDAKVRELISFRKDALNNFVAMIEPYRFTTDSEYEQMLRYQHEFFKAGYASKDIPAEYEMGATRIGGQMIDWFIIKAQSAGAEKTPLTVRLYNCLVNKYFFSLVVFSDNEKDMQTLEGIVYSSKFSGK
jgi:hypothetical protein